MTIMATKSRVIVQNEDSSSDNDSAIDTDSKQTLDEAEADMSANEEESDSHQDQELDNSDDADRGDGTANAGWADSIAKILKTNKPKGKKTLVLSKAKKLTDVHRSKPKDAGFEVQAEDGKIKREQIVLSETVEEKTEQPVRKKRKELPTLRVKPDILQKDRERTLSKIATKGVVQLFNAVKKQQKDIEGKLKEAGPLEVKRDKVLKRIDKREFLNVLMGDKARASDKPVKNETVTIQNKSKESEGPTWSVLRDDFMMGAKMKDWDKELEGESEIEQVMESE